MSLERLDNLIKELILFREELACYSNLPAADKETELIRKYMHKDLKVIRDHVYKTKTGENIHIPAGSIGNCAWIGKGKYGYSIGFYIAGNPHRLFIPVTKIAAAD